MLHLLQVIVGESQTNRKNKQVQHRNISKILMEQGFTNTTMMRSELGIGEQNDFRCQISETVQFDNLPIIIETTGSGFRIQKVIPRISEQMESGNLFTVPVYNLFKDSLPVKNTDFLLLKIFLFEKKHWFKPSLHYKVVRILGDHRLIWTNAVRGLKGPAKKKRRFFSFDPTPIIIESVVPAKMINELIPKLKAIIQDEVVIAIPVHVFFRQ
ncbi:DUF190 domain-containing protein [Ferviditalea candida]|uniref:DUF190 domain-containing protein n=1 Tax=Ferviditalea candida TaxID=3108399 RepID=A0ABU5ZFZ2_9BACL|nr:DUF190 domain-containing protein [Paenibacillaceae bacterium T2]